MKQQVKKRNKTCTFHQICVSYLIFNFIHLRLFLIKYGQSYYTAAFSSELVSSGRFSNNCLHADLLPSLAVNPALSSSNPPQLLRRPRVLNPKLNAKRKGNVIKLRISKCLFTKAIYSRWAMASLYHRHVLFTT